MSKLIKNIFSYVTIGLLILFTTNRLFFYQISFLENISNNISYPFLWTANKIINPIKKIIQKRHDKKELLQNYRKLKVENENILSENIKLKSIFNRFKLSKELVNFANKYNYKTKILVKILVKNFSSQEHYFLINKYILTFF